MDHQRDRLEQASSEAIRERLLREELEAKSRAAVAAERAMPLHAVGEWIESLQTARNRPGSKLKPG